MKIIAGRKPVLEAIIAGEDISSVTIANSSKGGIIDKIVLEAKNKGIPIKSKSNEEFDQMSGDANHQGVIASLNTLTLKSLEEIIHHSKKKEHPLILLLDSIQDPRNLGAILRTAECSEVDGVVLTKHNSASITETVQKTAAGAVPHLSICEVANLNNAIKQLKDEGFWIFGSTLDKAESYTKHDYKLPAALIIGNEEKGIRKLVADNCDFLIKIPMKGKIQSLNVSVAAGILLFEIMRSRSA